MYASQSCAQRARRKPGVRSHITIKYHRTARSEMLIGSGSSWWAAYATGERRDADFQNEVKQRFPDEPHIVLLKEWQDHMA